MNTATHANKLAITIVCPLCQQRLSKQNQNYQCPSCDRKDCPEKFTDCDGFPNLVIGDPFPDEDLPDRMTYEEECNTYSTQHYWIPLFRKLWPSSHQKPKLLAIGCGVGTEVDLLNAEGFSCFGVDNGNRSKFWQRRQFQDAFYMASGLHLPFPSEYFDGVFCGCVFAHVGVVGDSCILKPEGLEERQQLAKEMTRVVKPGGYIVAATPNRWFPFDLFHGRETGSYKVKFNPPGDRFLLSAGDFREMFIKQAGCQELELLPVTGFWGFIRANSNLKGYFLSLPVKIIFSLLSTNALRWLRASFLAPWLTVCVRK